MKLSEQTIRTWVERFNAGDRQALARLLTWADDGVPTRTLLASETLGRRGALKVGLTGSAGVGKSTLAAALVKHLRASGRSVAVLACDPASPFTGGALLGDRVRFDLDPADPDVFVRSISSRGGGGGMSPHAGEMVALLEQFGFETVLVETVGAGQDQLAVRRMVDVLVLVVTPESGDEVQWQKAGVLEAVNLIAVNKADLPWSKGAEMTAAQLRAVLPEIPAVKVAGASGQGVAELWDAIARAAKTVSAPIVQAPMQAVRGLGAARDSKQPSAVHPQRGFLPDPDPLDRLPGEFAAWEELGRSLPKWLTAGRLRRAVQELPLLDAGRLETEAQVRRAMVLLSFFGHAYIWGQPGEVVDHLPPALAVPWHALAQRLGRPPVLSYASYALDNWRRLDPAGAIELGNIVLLQNFLGGVDEEWFVLVHVEIEALAGPALHAIPLAQEAVAGGEPQRVAEHLDLIAATLERMHRTLLRMPERCDPYIYYNRVRPYIHGWKDQPARPRGVIYEGVEAYRGEPQQFRGETGAQSGIVPALDAALGVTHEHDPLRPYLLEMRQYMPPEHRVWVEALERGPSIRQYVREHGRSVGELRRAYNDCLQGLAEFRSLHLNYANRYIHSQSQRDLANPTQVGTGGTPFMPYLKKHRDETLSHQIGD